MCERCLETGINRLAEQVHHLDKVSEGHPVVCKLDRLLSVCGVCHLIVEKE